MPYSSFTLFLEYCAINMETIAPPIRLKTCTKETKLELLYTIIINHTSGVATPHHVGRMSHDNKYDIASRYAYTRRWLFSSLLFPSLLFPSLLFLSLLVPSLLFPSLCFSRRCFFRRCFFRRCSFRRCPFDAALFDAALFDAALFVAALSSPLFRHCSFRHCSFRRCSFDQMDNKPLLTRFSGHHA